MDDWDQFIELSTMAYNTSFHESIQCTPFSLIFGRLPRLPSSIPNTEETLPTYQGYLKDLVTRLYITQEAARKNTIAAKEKSKLRYDETANPHKKELSIGDSVFLYPGFKQMKLKRQCSGPYVISEILPNHNIKIKIGNKKYKTVHSNLVRYSHIEGLFPLDEVSLDNISSDSE